jgi:hypothetical protein
MARNLTDNIKANLARKKQTRIGFLVSLELQELVTKYREFYRQRHNEELTDDVLMSSVLESSFRNEKEFQKWLRVPANNQKNETDNVLDDSPQLFES